MRQLQRQIEPLEQRRLASATYVAIGKLVRTNPLSPTAIYFSKVAPAGNYLVAVVGGSMTYKNTVKRPVYRVNDYTQGDFGFKIVQSGERPINAPGLSVPKASGVIAAADSVGVFVKFRHSVSGKLGIELLDSPYEDNNAGPLGNPVFILKQRVTKKTAVKQAVVTNAVAVSGGKATIFSNLPIAGADLHEIVT